MTTTTDPYALIAQLKQVGDNQAREIDALKRQLAVHEAPDRKPATPESEVALRADVLAIMAQHAGEDVAAFSAAQHAAWTDEARDIIRAVRLHDWKRAPSSAWTTERPTEPGWYWWRYDATDSEPEPVHVVANGDGELCVLEYGAVPLAKWPSQLRTCEWQRAEPKP